MNSHGEGPLSDIIVGATTEAGTGEEKQSVLPLSLNFKTKEEQTNRIYHPDRDASAAAGFDLIIFHFSAPDAPPEQVECMPLSSSGLHLKWRAPPHDTWNGQIKGYRYMV